MSSKPTIVFVPGAWHRADGYDAVISELRDSGFDSVKVDLPSIGVKPGLRTWDKDVESIRSTIESTVEQGKDVVVVAHSYGSMPTNEAVKGLDKASREKEGKKGGIVSYVYCTAFVLPEGASLIDGLNGQDLPWWKRSDDSIVTPIDPGSIFYNDLDDATKQKWIDRLETFSYQMFYQKSTYAAYKHIPSTFIFCTQDNAIPLPVQQGMVDGSGANFNKVTIDASHSPFLSKVKETADAIRDAAGGKA